MSRLSFTKCSCMEVGFRYFYSKNNCLRNTIVVSSFAIAAQDMYRWIEFSCPKKKNFCQLTWSLQCFPNFSYFRPLQINNNNNNRPLICNVTLWKKFYIVFGQYVSISKAYHNKDWLYMSMFTFPGLIWTGTNYNLIKISKGWNFQLIFKIHVLTALKS